MTHGSVGESLEKIAIHRIFIPEREMRYSIGVIVVGFALTGAVALMSSESRLVGWRLIVLTIALVSTIPAAFIVSRLLRTVDWWRPADQGTDLLSALVIMYADFGVTAILITHHEAEAAMYGTAIFGLVGLFVAYFGRRAVVACHLVFTTAVIVGFAVLTLRQGDYRPSEVASRAMVSLLAANGSVVLVNRVVTRIQGSLVEQYRRATRDALTGLLNRNGFRQWVDENLGDWHGPVGFALVDIDHFKRVNDTYGHDAGDLVLAQFANRLARVVARSGIVARAGGEEFVVVALGDPVDLGYLAEAIRASAFSHTDTHPVTVSVGLATATLDAGRPIDLTDLVGHCMAVADRALYQAKRTGRNRVVLIESAAAATDPSPRRG